MILFLIAIIGLSIMAITTSVMIAFTDYNKSDIYTMLLMIYTLGLVVMMDAFVSVVIAFSGGI